MKSQPLFSTTGMLSPVVLAIFAIPTGFVLFTPEHANGFLKLFQSLVDGMTSLWPSLLVRAENTSFPRVSAVANCMFVIAAACGALVYLVQTSLTYPATLQRNRLHPTAGPLKHLLLLLFFPFVCYMGFANLGLAQDPVFASALTRTRMGYAFVALCNSFMAAAIGWYVSFVRLFVDLHIRGKQ